MIGIILVTNSAPTGAISVELRSFYYAAGGLHHKAISRPQQHLQPKPHLPGWHPPPRPQPSRTSSAGGLGNRATLAGRRGPVPAHQAQKPSVESGRNRWWASGFLSAVPGQTSLTIAGIRLQAAWQEGPVGAALPTDPSLD